MAESFPFVYVLKNSGNEVVKRELPENPAFLKTNILRKSWMNFLIYRRKGSCLCALSEKASFFGLEAMQFFCVTSADEFSMLE
ncbi:hypothetical protein ACH95_11560 [Bacillus glycinifermentans]|uniref:hypothetical protein n=1 Tax=Bacillus glycinifermentans TaxID=1664069 RepID=UPI000652B379|nr:hypothetical protein [Bacillus glycinifermentans]KMM59400.1 hypothetical protein ACH95_11560 [Bacillus glycinifermentans]MEC0496185.1 hypothetical protein [Bacillus glycinifermentans]MEC0539463.1 hypothetical protein [Bacillus glycinifermentans]